jgi:tRNA-Thr(GGU) m(6)t(6)A37 methyltransferase TsaA
MQSNETLPLRVIGTVHTSVADAEIPRRRRDIVSQILIADEYADGLAGIEEYSHLIVLFWMHKTEPTGPLVYHPRGDDTLPLTGVFASRGRNHPNPLGLAVVDLVKREAARLTVRRLDAYHGTPVVDIKPYDLYDVFTDIRVPEWFRRRAEPTVGDDNGTRRR